jgi:hypothetical protein
MAVFQLANFLDRQLFLVVAQKYDRQKEMLPNLRHYIFYRNNHQTTDDFKYSWIIPQYLQTFQSTDRSATVDSKMAKIDVCLKQLTKFLVAEGEKLTCIHKHLLEVPVDRNVNMSAV